MNDHDPISQFFPDQDSVDLYGVLHLKNTATTDEIKKAYRRLALVYHPDKHATATDQAKADASLRFQQIGFAYAVLGDEKRKDRYDKTGSTTEGFDLGAGEAGWEAYFEDLFDRITRGKLDQMKKEYQGSNEEIDDLKSAYLETNGSIGEIMTYIPHSTIEDEPRCIAAITKLIDEGALPKMKDWDRSVKDEKARLVRRKEGENEAKEAEALAKELGVWDEFYGSGKVGDRKSKSTEKKKKAKENEGEDGDGEAVLQALILKKREKTAADTDAFFDGLLSKYGDGGKRKGKGKKRSREDGEGSSKSQLEQDDIPDEEFAKLQEKLFGDTSKASPPKDKPTRKRRKASAK
ncbi:hypothetical protein AGABI2DRAFT_216409 [Agaricus bisporus var. bisporus H97]|uniref:hypothetical protein n=1 Tax=Agaricus bisporus var. bisporus (strain H97 / ATCC MYA-4626 / FGSC 10389) TaxID=936046 RepID=UPI00029F78BD|nr:hypothetical protein AGABI2DRAFT_216409 [Agaricus bisporus var. bisporus H97]EKV50094.1 hypothetical protein AGABI2DRAFT_216409 [Agaricus bisporus var. bisporus H97]